MDCTPRSSFTSFSLRFTTVAPNLALFTSKSANKPLKSSSLAVPLAELSIWLKIASKVMFRFGSLSHTLHTFSKSCEGRMKNPFSLTRLARTPSASASGRSAYWKSMLPASHSPLLIYEEMFSLM